MRLHITGASGSGVTTLGAALAHVLGAKHLDTDDFFWAPSDPPYEIQRAVDERLQLLRAAFAEAGDHWILSGSATKWGDPLISLYDHVIFLYTPHALRMERLTARESARFGVAIEPGGALHEKHQVFMTWAAGYDEPTFANRSRHSHEAWLARLSCPVTRLDGAKPTAMLVDEVVSAVRTGA
jgi:adenylate kinase family enzyme